eukprot:4902095-Lingulodinium_polyedra.AAC.1
MALEGSFSRPRTWSAISLLAALVLYQPIGSALLISLPVYQPIGCSHIATDTELEHCGEKAWRHRIQQQHCFGLGLHSH